MTGIVIGVACFGAVWLVYALGRKHGLCHALDAMEVAFAESDTSSGFPFRIFRLRLSWQLQLDKPRRQTAHEAQALRASYRKMALAERHRLIEVALFPEGE